MERAERVKKAAAKVDQNVKECDTGSPQSLFLNLAATP